MQKQMGLSMYNNILQIRTISKTKALSILDNEIDKELLSRKDRLLINEVAFMIEQLIARTVK